MTDTKSLIDDCVAAVDSVLSVTSGDHSNIDRTAIVQGVLDVVRDHAPVDPPSAETSFSEK